MAESTYLKIYGNQDITSGGAKATLADAFTAVAKANLVDGETFTITDETGTVITFEFDVTGDGVTAPNVAVDVSGDTTAADVVVTMLAAINGAGIELQAVEGTTTAKVSLTANNPGTQGNRAITEAVADAGFLVNTPMAGGADSPAVTPDTPGRGVAIPSAVLQYDLEVYNSSASDCFFARSASEGSGYRVPAGEHRTLHFQLAGDTGLFCFAPGATYAAPVYLTFISEPS